MEDRWEDEGGRPEEPYEESGDREPRDPKKPKLEGGAALPVPEPEFSEEELIGAGV